jgi:hypothetical protein
MNFMDLKSDVTVVGRSITVSKVNVFVPFDTMREVDGNRVDRIIVKMDGMRASVWDELDEGIGCTRPVTSAKIEEGCLVLELGEGKPRLASNNLGGAQ